jgi:hypothetical protein
MKFETVAKSLEGNIFGNLLPKFTMGDAGPSSDSGISGFSSPTSENGDIKKSPIQYFPKDEPYNPARPVKVGILVLFSRNKSDPHRLSSSVQVLLELRRRS